VHPGCTRQSLEHFRFFFSQDTTVLGEVKKMPRTQEHLAVIYEGDFCRPRKRRSEECLADLGHSTELSNAWASPVSSTRSTVRIPDRSAGRFPRRFLLSHAPSKARELAKVVRREQQGFDCAPWVHKAKELPREEFKREVERHLTNGEGNRALGDALFQGVQEPATGDRAGA
jgi:hypothetical protein